MLKNNSIKKYIQTMPIFLPLTNYKYLKQVFSILKVKIFRKYYGSNLPIAKYGFKKEITIHAALPQCQWLDTFLDLEIGGKSKGKRIEVIQNQHQSCIGGGAMEINDEVNGL